MQMIDQNLKEENLRKQVVFASAATYSADFLATGNLQIALNIDGIKVRGLGSQDGTVFPEIVVWRKSDEKAFMIEFIETSSTMRANVKNWARLASPNIKCTIIVPESEKEQLVELVRQNNIEPVVLQYFKLSGAYNSKIDFIEIPNPFI